MKSLGHTLRNNNIVRFNLPAAAPAAAAAAAAAEAKPDPIGDIERRLYTLNTR